MYKENDNLDIAEIERYRRMSQEERDKLMAALEKKALEEKQKLKENSK